MKLAIINGSPRGVKSNTKILLDNFVDGFIPTTNLEHTTWYLAKHTKIAETIAEVENADVVLLAFPLYTDCMPGIVKLFVDEFQHINMKGKQIAVIIQSGFPESFHSQPVARYFERLCSRLKAKHIGTVIKGGVEGIQIMPPKMTRKLFAQFTRLGTCFSEHLEFDPEIVANLAKPHRLSTMQKIMLRVSMFLGFSNYYWHMRMKEHNAYAKRFDAPYGRAAAWMPKK